MNQASSPKFPDAGVRIGQSEIHRNLLLLLVLKYLGVICKDSVPIFLSIKRSQIECELNNCLTNFCFLLQLFYNSLTILLRSKCGQLYSNCWVYETKSPLGSTCSLLINDCLRWPLKSKHTGARLIVVKHFENSLTECYIAPNVASSLCFPNISLTVIRLGFPTIFLRMRNVPKPYHVLPPITHCHISDGSNAPFWQ